MFDIHPAIVASMQLQADKGNANSRLVLEALDTVNSHRSPNGTMRRWFTEHNGRKVTTVQISLKNNHDGWAPVGRVITATPTMVRLNESRRDYKGCRVLHSDDSVLWVESEMHNILYIIEPTD